MKKTYENNAEKQKAYRARRKAESSKVEIRVVVPVEALNAFKRITRRKGHTLSAELAYIARKRENQLTNRMSDAVKLEYFADLD